MDVVIEWVDVDGIPRLMIRSGISDLLLHLGGRDTLTTTYHRFLRQRIAETLRIAKCILKENGDYFLQKTERINRLRRDELPKELRSKERLSRLLSSATLLTPWDAKVDFQEFFIDRSTTNITDEALLQIFAERWENERDHPLVDKDLTVYINMVREAKLGGAKLVKRTAVNEARKRLGIPKADERRKYYQEGKDFITMIAQQRDSRERLRLLQHRLKRLLPNLKNVQAQQTAQEWLEDVNKELQRE